MYRIFIKNKRAGNERLSGGIPLPSRKRFSSVRRFPMRSETSDRIVVPDSFRDRFPFLSFPDVRSHASGRTRANTVRGERYDSSDRDRRIGLSAVSSVFPVDEIAGEKPIGSSGSGIGSPVFFSSVAGIGCGCVHTVPVLRFLKYACSRSAIWPSCGFFISCLTF